MTLNCVLICEAGDHCIYVMICIGVFSGSHGDGTEEV